MVRINDVWRWLVGLGMAVAIGLPLALTFPSPTAAAEPAARYARFDVALDLREDGSFHVVETQVVDFDCCDFQRGHRNIPLTRIEDVTNIRVGELAPELQPYVADEPGTTPEGPGRYSWQILGDQLFIYWQFEPTSFQTRTFVVEYDVIGALRSYPNGTPPNQQIWWAVVGDALSEETPVESASMTITLPRAVDLAQVVLGADGTDEPKEHTTDGRAFTWQHGAVPAGEQFEVRLQFPPLIEGALPPAWQEADDAQRARAEDKEQRRASINLMLLAVGLALASGGGVGVFGLWFVRGRDPHTGLVADFLPRPPDDLPPGAAGTLLDERADERDVIATLVDLGHKGVLTITEEGKSRRRDFQLTLTGNQPTTRFEQELVRALFGPTAKSGATVHLSQVKERFDQASPAIKDQLYAELVTRGYFPRSPEATRDGWRRTGIILLVAAVIGGGVLIVLYGAFAWLPAVVAAILAGVLIKMGGSMPRKTRAGAEAAAKWNAFRRYLSSIERYEQVSEARGIFDTYLPYAVAFGLDQSWVRKFALAGAETPSWYDDGDRSGPRRSSTNDWPIPGGTVIIPSGGGFGGGSGSGVDLPDMPDLPDLQETSNKAGKSLQSSSDGLFALVGLAFEIFSTFSGGGGSGGSSGGGGGGFN